MAVRDCETFIQWSAIGVCMIRTCVWYTLAERFSISVCVRSIRVCISCCLTSVGACVMSIFLGFGLGYTRSAPRRSTLWVLVQPGLVQFFARGHCRDAWLPCKQIDHNLFSAENFARSFGVFCFPFKHSALPQGTHSLSDYP